MRIILLLILVLIGCKNTQKLGQNIENDTFNQIQIEYIYSYMLNAAFYHPNICDSGIVTNEGIAYTKKNWMDSIKNHPDNYLYLADSLFSSQVVEKSLEDCQHILKLNDKLSKMGDLSDSMTIAPFNVSVNIKRFETIIDNDDFIKEVGFYTPKCWAIAQFSAIYKASNQYFVAAYFSKRVDGHYVFLDEFLIFEFNITEKSNLIEFQKFYKPISCSSINL